MTSPVAALRTIVPGGTLIHQWRRCGRASCPSRRAAALGFVLAVVSQGSEAIHGSVRKEHDIAAAASVASVGAAARDELLPVEANQAVPTVPRRHVYVCTVNHACQSRS